MQIVVYQATFKVRILNPINQLPKLTVSADEYNIAITCMQEYYNSELNWNEMILMMVGHLSWYLYGKNTTNATIGVVEMLLIPHALKSLDSIKNPTKNFVCYI